MKKLVIIALLIIITFQVRVQSTYFEDNSGVLRITYCIPFGLCD